MEPLTSNVQLVEMTQRIRGNAADFTTNFFTREEITQAWIGRGALFYMEGAGSLLLFRRDRDFFHLYHFASEPAALGAALASLDLTPSSAAALTADLVGRPDQAKALSGIYQAHGFDEYTSLFRMVRILDPSHPEIYEDPEVVPAEGKDAPMILDFLEQLLDRFAEQIPEQEDIQTAIAQRSIILVRRSDEPGGLLFFETAGLTSILRYWHVSERCRDQGIGARLIRTYFRLCRAGRRIILWVITSNDAAIAKYRHYGFQSEGLVDTIMIKRRR